MIELADTLLSWGRAAFLLSFAVFLRMGAAMAVLPAFGEQSVPRRVRLVLALALTALVTPMVADRVLPLVADGQIPGRLYLTEPIAGLALGIAIRLFIYALQIAGEIAAQSASLAQIFGGTAVDAQPAFGHVLLVGGLALAAMTGLHVKIVGAYAQSYDMLPPGEFAPATVLTSWGVGRMAEAFALAFTVASPFVIASLIYNLTLGVINRAMPQLMVAFVGAPAISGGGLLVLFLAAPVLLAHWLDAFDLFLADPAGATR